MPKGFGGGLDFPPGSKKGVTTIAQEGAEGQGGAGGFPESAQERQRMSALIQSFANDWASAESIHAAFLDRRIEHSELDAYLDQRAEQIDRIDAELKKIQKELPEGEALAALVKDSRKAYAQYAKKGKGMLGQQLREQDSLFEDMAKANAAIISLGRSFQGAGNGISIEQALEIVTQTGNAESDDGYSALGEEGGSVKKTRRGTRGGADKLKSERVGDETLQGEAPSVEASLSEDEMGASSGPGSEASPIVLPIPTARKKGSSGKKGSGVNIPESVRAAFAESGEDQGGEAIGQEGARVRSELKNRPAEPADMPAIATGAKVSRGLFEKGGIDPLSPEATPAEVRGTLEGVITAEAERLAAGGVAEGEVRREETYPDTPELFKARLDGRVAREAAEAAYKQKDAEYAAVETEKKAAYLAALTEHQKSRKFLDATSERMGFKQTDPGKEKDELKELKREWTQARLNRSRARLDAVLERRAARGATVEKGSEEEQKVRADKVLERFQRRYLLREATSVAIAAANEESQVRAQALSDRDRHVVDRIFKYAKDHPKVMLGISTLATLGGVVSTAGAGFALPAVAVALGSLISLRHKWKAQGRADALKAESEKEDANAQTIAKIRAEQAKYQARSSLTTLSGLSSLFAGGLTKLLTGKDRAQAQRTIQGAAVEITNLKSEDALAKLEELAGSLDAAYAKLRQADAKVARNAMAAGIVGGFAGGAAVGALAPHESASTTIGNTGEFIHDKWTDLTHHDTPTTSADATTADKLTVETGTDQAPPPAEAATKLDVELKDPTTADAAAPAPEKGPEASDTVAPAGAAKADAAPAAPTAPEVSAAGAPHAPVVEGIAKAGTPDGLLVGATISKAGDGFGDMLVDFKHNFNDQLGSTIDTPKPALDYVLSTNVNEIAHKIGAAENGQSLTMHMGDQFVVDENQNIWFQPANGEPQLVIENVPVSEANPNGFVIHKLDTTGDMRPDVIPTQAPATTEAAQTVGGTTTEAPVPTAAVDAPTPLTVDQNIVGVTVDQNVKLEPGLKVPENLDTTVPAEAPKPPVVAPEQAPVPVPQYEVVGTAHPFAQPDAGPLLNPNGVDLNKPQILVNENRYWALGTSNEDSYNRAAAFSQELSKTPGASTEVFFTVKEYNDLGVERLEIRKVFTPPGSETPLMAPFGPGAKPVADLPDASKFTLPTKR